MKEHDHSNYSMFPSELTFGGSNKFIYESKYRMTEKERKRII